MSRCSSLCEEVGRRRASTWAEPDVIFERLIEEFAEQNRLLEEDCHDLQGDLACLEGSDFTWGFPAPEAPALRIEVRDWDVAAKDTGEATVISQASSALDELSLQSELDVCQRLRRELQAAEDAATEPLREQASSGTAMHEELQELQNTLSQTCLHHEAECRLLLDNVQRLQGERDALHRQALQPYLCSLSQRAIAAARHDKESGASVAAADSSSSATQPSSLKDQLRSTLAAASRDLQTLQTEHDSVQEECRGLAEMVDELKTQRQVTKELPALVASSAGTGLGGLEVHMQSTSAAASRDIEVLQTEHHCVQEECRGLAEMVNELKAQRKITKDTGLQNYVHRLSMRALGARPPEESQTSGVAADRSSSATRLGSLEVQLQNTLAAASRDLQALQTEHDYVQEECRELAEMVDGLKTQRNTTKETKDDAATAVSVELAELQEVHSWELQRHELTGIETAEQHRMLQEEIEGLRTECRQVQNKALQPYVRGLSYRVLAVLDRQELRHSTALVEPRSCLQGTNLTAQQSAQDFGQVSDAIGVVHTRQQQDMHGPRNEEEYVLAEQRETQLLQELESLRSECNRAEEKAQQLRRRSTVRSESADEAWEQVTKLQGKLERCKRRHADEEARLEAGTEHLEKELRFWESRAAEVEHLGRLAAQSASDACLVEAVPKRKEHGTEEDFATLAGELEALRLQHSVLVNKAQEDDAKVEEAFRSAAVVEEQAVKLEGRLEKWKRRHADEVDRREAAEDLASRAEAEIRSQLQEAKHLRGSMLEEEEVSKRLSSHLDSQVRNEEEEQPEVVALREEVLRCRRSCEEGEEQAEDLEKQLRQLRDACGEEAEEVAAADDQATKLEMRVERWRRRHSAEVEKREVAVEDMEKAEDALVRFVEEAKETDVEGILASEWRKAHEQEVERGELAAVEAADAAEHQLLDLRAGIEAWKRTYELESQGREQALKEELEALHGWREDAPEDGHHSCGALVECRWRCLAEVLLCDEYAEAARLGAYRASALAVCRWEHLAGQLLQAGLVEVAERSKWQAAALAAIRWGRLVDLLLRGQREEALFVEMAELGQARISIETLRSELEAAGAQETPSFCGPEALPWESADSASLGGQEVEQLIAAREQAFVLVGQLQDQHQRNHMELQDALQFGAEESIEVRDLEASQLLLQQENLDYKHAFEASQRTAAAEAEELRQVLEELRCVRGQTLQGGLVSNGNADGSETDITTPRGAEASSGGEACSVRSASYPPSDSLRGGQRARLAHRKEAREARAAQAASGQRTPPD